MYKRQKWDLLDSEQVSVVRNISNGTQFVIPSWDLPVGDYVLRVNTTLSSSVLDLSQKARTTVSYIEVTKSSLTAGINGSSYFVAEFNSTLFWSAYNHTFASGQPISDKARMTFEWRCKRSNETWPTQLPSQSYVPYNGTGGCFGDVGPGVLGFADMSWNLSIDTSYLEPLLEYDIQFAVWRDGTSATADVFFYVKQPLAPVVSVRSVENLFIYLSVCLSVYLSTPGHVKLLSVP